MQSLYAQTLAERGFLTIAFDPSFTGESGGNPRYVASPDINTEDFCAAVDFLATNEQVDSEDTYEKLTGDNKELLIVPGANHTDLYDNFDKIPFDKIETFFRTYLK